jgi:hypothetical protein
MSSDFSYCDYTQVHGYNSENRDDCYVFRCKKLKNDVWWSKSALIM